MPASKEEKEFVSYIVELMQSDLIQSIGTVKARGMFGGHGIFLDGSMFGLVADSVLYLKVDDENKSRFEEKGLEPFTYNKNGKEFKMSYYQAPEETLENSEEMSTWANLAYQAALRAAALKKK